MQHWKNWLSLGVALGLLFCAVASIATEDDPDEDDDYFSDSLNLGVQYRF